MPKEVSIKTHLIVTDVHEEYHTKWCGRIIDSKPVIKNGKPIFIVVGSRGRIELNTTDMKEVERIAKRLTEPKGRKAFTTDNAYIYIKEVDGHEKKIGIVQHHHIKRYAQMYDKVGYR